MAVYDDYVRETIGPEYGYPIRLRNWELDQVIESIDREGPLERCLDTGSVNTFFGLWLAQHCPDVTVSDLMVERVCKNLLRRARLLPRKPSEANIETWYRAIRANGSVRVKNIDLTRMAYADGSFDLITSISVIEHIPDYEKAVAEMYRCLKVGGKLLLTTDCTPEGKPYGEGVRYFSPDELEVLVSPYPVTSERAAPDFAEKHWCYHRDQPLVTAFVEITKTA